MKLQRLPLQDRPTWTDQPVEIPAAPEGVRAGSPEHVRYVLEERYRERRVPLSARLPFHYHHVPARVRFWAARYLATRSRPPAFPHRPIEPALDALRWAGGLRARWPGGRQCALLLTHDVDTWRGMDRVADVARLEHDAGVRSAFFVCSHHYPLDLELLSGLESRGFEVASHGHDHDNRIAFSSEEEREARLLEITSRFDTQLTLRGFRSPSLCRTPELFSSLSRHFVYDSSIPDVDLEGAGGCATVFPFWIGRLLEIPVTLPMESSLLYAGESPSRIFECWSEKLAWIKRVRGVATAILHTEPHLGGHPELLQGYRGWLRSLDPEIWVTTPSRLARHVAETFLAPPHVRPCEAETRT